ncbi:MAG: hypothetical protein BGO55_00565 [Sphingobacteriales bacterium 50-39]|nr:phage tail protein [Sphingobacteriales bacterium]OJW53607.1 MAG: hypothetical protein BGO55_00565 [Sphingobacteriales bacterium 50-39]
MDTLDIYRAGSLFVTIKPDDSSTQTKKVMGDNTLQLTFKDSRNIQFMVNDYCTVFGEKYLLNSRPVVKKDSSYYWEYSLNMDADSLELSKAQFLFLGADNTLRESDFSLMGTADTFMDLLIQNANRVGGSWIKGNVVGTGYHHMTFSGQNCYEALGKLATEFDTEFWIDGRTVHLFDRARDTGYSFRQGRNKGLYDITRLPTDNTSIVTRLYAFGANKNLPASYRNSTPRLLMTEGTYYLEKNVDKYGVIEATQIFDDIFPTRTGKVTAVDAANVFHFIDATMDFNLNDYLLPGLTAKVTFNTGQLAGYTFEISAYDNTTKQFTILQNKDETAIAVPSAELNPGIGDQYVLVDITLPQIYIDAAEVALKAKAQATLDLNAEPQETYKITFDPVFLKKRNIIPVIGDLVWLWDGDLDVDRKIRVTATTRGIVNEWDLQVDLSDKVSPGIISRITQGVADNADGIAAVNNTLQNTAILNRRIIGDLRIDQGTIILLTLPSTASMVGFTEVVVENATGRVYKKI